MLLARKAPWKRLLKRVDHEVAASALVHHLADHSPSAALAEALEAYFASPEYGRAIRVVLADPTLILLFRECSPGGVYWALYRRAAQVA